MRQAKGISMSWVCEASFTTIPRNLEAFCMVDFGQILP
jgi:hypothetical protein